jgi:hypothetical protein
MPIPIEIIIRFGDDWRSTHAVLNALATPVGRRYCQPARYPKKRALAEAWLEVRDKWVEALRQIDADVSADNLPWDDGRYRYYHGFYFSFLSSDKRYSVGLVGKSDRVTGRTHGHSFVFWDPATERFGFL